MMSRCWPFDGWTENGYGRAWFAGRIVQVHRAVYEALVGPIPEGLQLDHLCRNRSCYNPAHLEPVTHAENVRRGMGGAHNRRKDECPAGHPYSDENTYRYPNGRRGCRTCHRNADRTYRQRRKALQGVDR